MDAKLVTYSPSLTIPLTRACVNQCLYCGYRKEGDGLLPLSDIKKMVKKAHQEGVSEILILSGEKADKTPEVQRDLYLLGMTSFVSWTMRICEYLLDEKLLPHVNIGTLDEDSLKQLRHVSASMGLMIEGVNQKVNARIHPDKKVQGRLGMIESAGKLKIPFTTGILLGTGEEQEDRFASILAIEGIQKKYGHIQEIILQRYVPNSQSHLRPQKISFHQMEEFIQFCKSHLPNVSIQIPPNLEPNWGKLVALGVNDLGGIGSDGDLINPRNPWPEINIITTGVMRSGGILKKRLPIYPLFYRMGWYSEKVGKILKYWIEGNDEYRYYS